MIVTFTFSRRIGYYLINFYVPCIIMVIMSWIVFWMDRDCIGDRIALGITTVLTIVFLLGSSNSTMPRVSYPKAIDWYLMTSFIFVFTTLLMCLLIFRFDRQLNKRQRPPRSVSCDTHAETVGMQVRCSFEYIPQSRFPTDKPPFNSRVTEGLDFHANLIFKGTFIEVERTIEIRGIQNELVSQGTGYKVICFIVQQST